MSLNQEIHDFLLAHLQSIMTNDVEAYHKTTSEDLTLYEWWVTPHRLDGLPFHDFMITESDRRGAIFGTETDGDGDFKPNTRFDLANLRIQKFGETAIASYTLLISTGFAAGVKVAAHNESRVIVKIDGEWRVVHAHKSPAWQAPHIQPE